MIIGLVLPPAMAISLVAPPKTVKKRMERRQQRIVGNLGLVVRRHAEFLKNRISKGVEWANGAFRIPQLSKTLDDLNLLRNFENPHVPSFSPLSWPQPFYPELSAVDLFLADLKALEAYSYYLYYLAKLWAKPLPEVYDPEDVAGYFTRRPHVVALRLLEVFFAFAFAAIRIRTSGVKKFYMTNMDRSIDGDFAQQSFGLVLKETMLNLGPTFIKVGQSLSTRPDIIGPEISKALSELHDQIPPFPRTSAMEIIENELGCPVETYFSHLSEEPVAAASFGQVYRGRTVDGIDVAVKVQRPNLCHVVIRDVYIARLGLGLLEKITKGESDLRLYVDELGKGLIGQLDYTLEAANVSEFMQAHAAFPFIRAPKVFQHLSRKRVLTMEWMTGESPRDLIDMVTAVSVGDGSGYAIQKQSDARRRLLDLANKGVEASLIQLLETGLLHADPHPGNLLYLSSGEIGVLDFGLLCRMQKKHQLAMLASIVHTVNGNWALLAQALIDMDVVRPGTNIWRVTMDLEDALGEVEFKGGIPEVMFSKVFGKVWSVALKYHFRMPPYCMLVLHFLASLQGLAVAADPNFKAFEAAYPFVVKKLLTDNSAATRRILYSVVLNRKKQLQWQKLALFLRTEANRKVLHRVLSSSGETCLHYSAKGVFDVANLVLRFLPSKDGAVMRRLLMTADGASLIQALVSKEAIVFRKQLCRLITEIIFQWMSEACVVQYSSRVSLASDSCESPRLATPISDYGYILRDRRLKVIFSKVLHSARKDPLLMLRFFWASFVMLVSASSLAFHRMLVALSEDYLSPDAPFASKRSRACIV